MDGSEEDEIKTRAPLAVWIPASIIVGLLILLLVGVLVLS